MVKIIRVLIFLIAIWSLFSGPLAAQSPAFVTTISNCFGGSLQEEFFGGSACLDGGYLLTGLSNSDNGDINMPVFLDTANIFIVKCDSQGNKEWTRTFGGNDFDKARFGIQDSDSNYVIVGTTHSNDGDITFTHGNSELFVIKLDPSGNLIWMKQYGGTSYESGRYIMQLSDGNYMITGYTASNNFDVPPGRGGHDGWLLKLDTNGIVLWSQTYGGSAADRIRHVEQTTDGGFIFSGSSESNDQQCIGGHGGMDVWVGKTDSIGNLLWSKVIGGSAEDYAYHITPTSGGAYLVTGYSASVDGDATSNYGSNDGWIIKVDDQGNIINQRNFGGSNTDRLYKSYETIQGNIVTAGFSQSSDYELSGINTGPSKSYWLMTTDSSLNVMWSYCTGGTGADLGKELVFNPTDSSMVIMGDSNSGNGNVLGNHGDFDFWLVKLALFTSLPQLPENNNLSVFYSSHDESLVIASTYDMTVSINVNDLTGKNIRQLNDVKIYKGKNIIAINALQSVAEGIYLVNLEGVGVSLTSKILHISK